MSEPSKNRGTSHEDLVSGCLYFTRVDKLLEKFNMDAFSMSDILQIIRPRLSLHFSFMIDLDWLLQQYPASCRHLPIMCVVGEKMGTNIGELRESVNTNKWNNISVLGAKLPIAYGTHHTKLSLFESKTGLHVIVSTANLTEADWDQKTQCFYYVTGPFFIGSAPLGGDFVNDLCSYLPEYHLHEVDYWIDRIKSCDFSAISDRLVFSVPGYHHSTRMSKFGHPSLARLLKDRSPPPKGASRLFIAQCSSIGALGDNSKVWLDQFLRSLQGGKTKDLALSKFRLIFPCVDDVRNSLEGYGAGDYIPYSELTALGQTWLDEMMCKWRSEKKGRSKAMPHVKTYTELLYDVPQWLLVTSANLSRAAWGEYQKKNTQFMVRSYELGVLITDPLRMKLPYDYPLTGYDTNDSPWMCDVSYTETDSHGEKRMVDTERS